MAELNTPEEIRDFLRLCLNPPGRGARTPAQLAQIMPDWVRGPLHEHAPHLAALRAEAERLDEAAARAHRAHAAALAKWIEGTEPPSAEGVAEEQHMPDMQPSTDRTAELAAILREVLTHFGPMHDVYGGPVTYYDGFAGVEPKTYERWQAALDGIPAGLDPAEADNPTPLRWGLHDILWGDDDSVTLCLSGPDGEPYWLELGPERAAVMRDDLRGPHD
ncbi:hypothetical protein AB0958_18975 [Streptomyces sp. NPDC006655]|uniref:hypothetical protein n=1 Tax=Streptomyces sp. NPDC006655 TaxID=3156898 RepID=UPI003455C3D9